MYFMYLQFFYLNINNLIFLWLLEVNFPFRFLGVFPPLSTPEKVKDTLGNDCDH